MTSNILKIKKHNGIVLTSDMDMIVTTQNHTSDLSCN